MIKSIKINFARSLKTLGFFVLDIKKEWSKFHSYMMYVV